MKTLLYKVLLVLDQPMVTLAYERAFAEVTNESSYHFQVDAVYSFKEAIRVLKGLTGKKLEVVFIDLNLSPYKNLQMYSGQDFALYVKKHFSATKIVIISLFTNAFKIHNVFYHVNPDGFLVKKEITPALIKRCIREVIDCPPFYSKSVIRALRKYSTEETVLDEIDLQLLYYLSIGDQTKKLPSLLPLSLASVERRKKRLREIFEVQENKTDCALILAARELGFL